MQTCQTIFTGSGGWKYIRAGTVSYCPASYGIVKHRINGSGVPRCQDKGSAGTGAPAFSHPEQQGIIIAIPGETLPVPGTAVEVVARGAIAGAGMQPVDGGRRGQMTIGLYTRTGCPHCEELAGLLTSLAVPFDILPVDNPENISELRNNGMYLSGAPVLRVGDTWPGPAGLCSGGYLAAGQVSGIITGAGHV